MINPGLKNYEVVLSDTYYLRELVQSITLEDNLSEISYCASVKMVVIPEGFPQLSPGQEIRISGAHFDSNIMAYLLHPGIVWEAESNNRGLKHFSVTIYDKTIYLSRSEDEYLFPAGQTATQRLMKYVGDWKIPIGQLEDTKIPLAKALYRPKSILQMIMSDLKETATNGGDMYRPRMTSDGLQLIKVGGNEIIWVLEEDQNISEITQRRTLEGAVTRVKVLGKQPQDTRSPVLAIVEGEVSKYGALQRVYQDEKLTNVGLATQAGKRLLSGEQETFTVQCIDINTIRAGDMVSLNDMDLIVCSVKHELGSPGQMTMELASSDYVRRRFYLDVN